MIKRPVTEKKNQAMTISLFSSILLTISLSSGLRGLASMPRSADMLVALFLFSWGFAGYW